MSLLEVITQASANSEQLAPQSEYPIILNADDIFCNLKPKLDIADPASLAIPVSGWKISETDAQLIESAKKFYAKLKRKLKDTSHFNKDVFVGILNPFLRKLGKRLAFRLRLIPQQMATLKSQVLIEKAGFFIGRDVASLVLEACISLEIWDLVEKLIVKGIVVHSCHSYLVTSLVAKKRSDLLCLSIKHTSDFGLLELVCILKYFLSPSKDAYISVMKKWESQAAIEKDSL